LADVKISALPASTVPLAGTEVLPIVQSGTTKQVSVANLTAGRAISATQLTLTTGNLIVATGQGIDFSATSGTGTSELLNDYEEGTWTATLIGSTTAPLTPVTATGTYTKIGNLVTIFANFGNVDTTGALGDMQVTGIPFTAGNSARAFGSTTFGKVTLTGAYAFCAIYNSDNKVIFSEDVSGGYGPNVAIPTTTGVFVQFSITYRV
jgi:hypothetical protein